MRARPQLVGCMVVLIIPLGATNDEEGRLDAEAGPRVAHVACRYKEIIAAGRKCRVLPSGGSDPEFRFNPTRTPHWEYMSAALVKAGLPESALIRPGLPALHTVDEAIYARAHVLNANASGSDHAVDEVVVVTSDFHAARARHLFGVAFGAHARCPVPMQVEEHPGSLASPELEARREHEKQSIRTLRTAPFGAWLHFIQEHRLEACNKSLRHSRALPAATYDTAVHGYNLVAPSPSWRAQSVRPAGQQAEKDQDALCEKVHALPLS